MSGTVLGAKETGTIRANRIPNLTDSLFTFFLDPKCVYLN